MGMVIFEKSGTFNPSDYGLEIGTVLNIICVGGGSSGAVYAGTNYYAQTAGGTSSFGTFVSSNNGSVMGKGGLCTYDSDRKYYSAAPGAGGWMPGLPEYGGNGAIADQFADISSYTPCVVGLAGCYNPRQALSPYCNSWGVGNKGAAAYTWESNNTTKNLKDTAGGNGYGAGGPAAYAGTYSDSRPMDGGDAGKIFFGTHILQNLNSIAVTVGVGGTKTAFGYTSYSTNVTYYVSSSGAPGIVVVTW